MGGVVEDASGETNMAAYVAVGVWHHWLVRRDERFVTTLWPTVRDALDFACSMQLPFGGIAWSQEWSAHGPARVNRDGLLAGSSSIHHALRAGLTLAELLDDPQPEWELTAGRLGHALREHRDRFLDKSTFSMDWYYPVLGGAVRGEAGRELIDSRWHDFVVPGLGVRCVDTNPWVTGAESCELVLALDALGDRERAVRLFADVQHLRSDDGRLLDRLRLPRRGALARRAHDVHHGSRPARPRRAHAGRPRAPTWSAARGWYPTRSRSRSSAAAPQPTLSPAVPDRRRSTRSEPTTSTSAKAPESSARR